MYTLWKCKSSVKQAFIQQEYWRKLGHHCYHPENAGWNAWMLLEKWPIIFSAFHRIIWRGRHFVFAACHHTLHQHAVLRREIFEVLAFVKSNPSSGHIWIWAYVKIIAWCQARKKVLNILEQLKSKLSAYHFDKEGYKSTLWLAFQENGLWLCLWELGQLDLLEQWKSNLQCYDQNGLKWKGLEFCMILFT